MAARKRFRVLVATDGSRVARAAVTTAVRFPWPAPSDAHGVVARYVRPDYRRSILLAALDRTSEVVAARTTRVLAARWPDAQAVVVNGAPADAIVREAARVGADVIVIGWRGQGPLRRLLAGSVSRGVVRRAPCAVLVTRRALTTLDRVVVGVDGSSQARAAVDFVARLPGRGRRVTLLTAVEKMALPSQVHLTSAMQATARSEIDRINRGRQARARTELDRARTALARRGWKVELVVASRAPLRELLRRVGRSRADLLVVGARGATGLDRLLLGSVASGALDRSPIPVVVVP
ncbi:MAG: universal stress protein [Gemmatimonadetes bacterium]|nr:universal stress protein [Gemmatimonadota bacterium]